ncbi:MAG TPA: dienelactone hydrolase family protein [Burkholderiales bacterium]|nr:dienelactone hydrolase family protein [Burkholderiales bacterium]
MLIASEACAQGLPGSETVILRVDHESIYAHLFRPESKGRHPAMVLVHGFDGVSEAREGFWARELATLGVVTLVIESFSARSVGTSIANQSSVSTAQGVRDAYAAFGYLAAQKEIDAARIGIMGMSRGGSVALRAVDHRKQGGAGPGFAAAVALYPGCVAQYRNPQPSAPIQVLVGAADDYTMVKHCADYLQRIRAAGGSVELRVYPGAHHGFDGDTPKVFVPSAQNLSGCLLYIEDDGSTTYAKTGEVLESPSKASEVMRRDCIKMGATIGADARVKAQALQHVKAFLKQTLLARRSPT